MHFSRPFISPSFEFIARYPRELHPLFLPHSLLSLHVPLYLYDRRDSRFSLFFLRDPEVKPRAKEERRARVKVNLVTIFSREIFIDRSLYCDYYVGEAFRLDRKR